MVRMINSHVWDQGRSVPNYTVQQKGLNIVHLEQRMSFLADDELVVPRGW